MSLDTINEKAAAEFHQRGQKAEQAGDLDKAIENYQHALNEDEDHEPAAFRLAVLYDRRGMDHQAIELYERLCAGDPVHVSALLNLAVLYEDNGMYDDARRALEAIIESDPDHGRARLFLKDVMSAAATHVDEDAPGQRGGRAVRDAVLDLPVASFELSVRSRNALKKMNIESVGDLLRVREVDLLSHKNFGETSLSEIKSLLASKGLRLGQFADGDGGAGAAGAGGATPIPAAFAGGTAADEPAFTATSSGGGGVTPGEMSLLDPGDDVPGELLERSVGDLELSVRSRKALQRLNIHTVAELASRTEDELLGCKNFGQTSLNEIKQVLGSFGLGLRRLEE